VFPHVDPIITEEEFAALNEFLGNHKYYEDNWLVELNGKKEWKARHVFNNTRWQRNYEELLNGLRLYAETESEFKQLEEVLYNMHINYTKYINSVKMGRFEWPLSKDNFNVDEVRVTDF
jgi:hypothetical protein